MRLAQSVSVLPPAKRWRKRWNWWEGCINRLLAPGQSGMRPPQQRELTACSPYDGRQKVAVTSVGWGCQSVPCSPSSPSPTHQHPSSRSSFWATWAIATIIKQGKGTPRLSLLLPVLRARFFLPCCFVPCRCLCIASASASFLCLHRVGRRRFLLQPGLRAVCLRASLHERDEATTPTRSLARQPGSSRCVSHGSRTGGSTAQGPIEKKVQTRSARLLQQE